MTMTGEDTTVESVVLEQLDFQVPCRALPPEVDPQCPSPGDWGGWCRACGALAVTLCFEHATWLRMAHVRVTPMKHLECGATDTVEGLMRIAPLPRARG